MREAYTVAAKRTAIGILNSEKQLQENMQSLKSQFEKLTTKVFIDKSWVEAYKKACSKMEWQFIHSQKYVRQMIDMAEEIRKDKLKFEKDYHTKQ